jgi:hypothetical protein
MGLYNNNNGTQQQTSQEQHPLRKDFTESKPYPTPETHAAR